MYVIKNYATGEIWEIDDYAMRVNGGHYYRRALEELKWAVHHHPETLLPELDVCAEILYRDKYDRDRHIGSIYYHLTDTHKMTSWHCWRDNEPYHHSCFKFVNN